MKKNLKLYIWKDVLTDYTSGMMVTLAPDVGKARNMLLKECSYIPAEDLAKKPIVRSGKCAFVVWGGG